MDEPEVVNVEVKSEPTPTSTPVEVSAESEKVAEEKPMAPAKQIDQTSPEEYAKKQKAADGGSEMVGGRDKSRSA
jgi:hypothetical protein